LPTATKQNDDSVLIWTSVTEHKQNFSHQPMFLPRNGIIPLEEMRYLSGA